MKPWVWWNDRSGNPIFINTPVYFPPHIYTQIFVYEKESAEIVLCDRYTRLAAAQEYSFGNVYKVVWNYPYASFSTGYLARHKTHRFPTDKKM